MSAEDSFRPPITHVAIRFQGKTWSLPKPNRHHHVISLIVQELGIPHVDAHEDDQGFLDASGRYLNRRQALVSAEDNDQLLPGRPVYHEMLFSENVW